MSIIHLESDPTEHCTSLIINKSQDALLVVANLQQSISRMDVSWQGGESESIHARFLSTHRELEARLQELSSLGLAMQREIQQWIDTDNQGASIYQSTLIRHPLPYLDFLLPIVGGAGLINWFPHWISDWYRLLPGWLRHFIDPYDLIPINDPIHIPPLDSLEPVTPPIKIDDPVHDPGIIDPSHPPVGLEPEPISIDDPIEPIPEIVRPVQPITAPETTPSQPGADTPPQDNSGGGTVPVNPPVSTPVSQPTPPTYSVPAKGQGSEYGNAGCSPTSVSMVLDYYHNQNANHNTASTSDLINMLDTGDGTIGKGISLSNMTDELADLGYHNVSQGINANLDQLKEQLAGGPVIVTTGVSISGPGSIRGGDVRAISGPGNTIHAMVVTGLSADGSQVMVNDPWSGQAVTYSTETFSSMWSRGANGYYSIRP